MVCNADRGRVALYLYPLMFFRISIVFRICHFALSCPLKAEIFPGELLGGYLVLYLFRSLVKRGRHNLALYLLAAYLYKNFMPYFRMCRWHIRQSDVLL